jgi:hypothetical protein
LEVEYTRKACFSIMLSSATTRSIAQVHSFFFENNMHHSKLAVWFQFSCLWALESDQAVLKSLEVACPRSQAIIQTWLLLATLSCTLMVSSEPSLSLWSAASVYHLSASYFQASFRWHVIDESRYGSPPVVIGAGANLTGTSIELYNVSVANNLVVCPSPGPGCQGL